MLTCVVLLVFVNWGFEYLKWITLLDFSSIRLERRSRLKSFLAGIITGLLTPNMIGNFIGRIFYFQRRDRPSIILLTLFSNAAQFLASILFGIIAIVWLGFPQKESAIPFNLFVIVSFSAFCILTLLYLKFERIPFRILQGNKYVKRIAPLMKRKSFFRIKLLFFSMSRHFIFSLQYWLLLKAFGIDINIEWMGWIWQVFFWTTLIPSLWFGKLVIREGMALLILGQLTDANHQVIILVTSIFLWILNQAVSGCGRNSLFTHQQFKKSMIWLYIIIFSVFSSICMFGFWIRWQWNKNYQEKKHFFPIEEISVVIPFRNEAENLPALIASLNKLQRFPREIIWVNDHSEDDFETCFQSLSVPFKSTLIHLAAEDAGKKTALRAGIADAMGKYILTWDADIEVNKNYFHQLANTPLTDFLVLPVSMPGKTINQLFFELDYQYLNALNVAVSGHTKPIVASGANLLFDKEIFDEIDSFEEHADVASGDDIFLLQDFKRNKKDIELALHPDLQVKTKVPQNWEAFFQQRLRWIGKSKKVGDKLASYLGIIGMIYHVGFWLMFFTDASWNQLLILTIVKILLDGFTLLPYLIILKRPWTGFFIPVFSLVYPVYMLMILVMTLFYEPEWKGRTLNDNRI